MLKCEKQFRAQVSNTTKPLLVHTNEAPLVPVASQAIRGLGELGFLPKRTTPHFSTRVLFIELQVCSVSHNSLLGFCNPINSFSLLLTNLCYYLPVFLVNYGLVLIITSETELEITGHVVQRF